MKTSTVLALLVPLLAASPALAQGTQAQRQACTPDVFRLCASAIPNVGNITACLAQSRDRLSPACRTAMDEAGGTTRQAEAAPAPQPRRQVLAAAPRGRVAARAVPDCACTPRVAARVATSRQARLQRQVYVQRQAYAPRSAPRRGYARSRHGSEMAQAMYWMQTLSSMGGGALGGSLGGSMGGLSLGSLAGLMQ